ncbi:type 4a pilus biogenesis protein PilO [Myxococcota bacterium]|nr:type 4a pilus biogenesis protein PilO [Myxococcota bacterium]
MNRLQDLMEKLAPLPRAQRMGIYGLVCVLIMALFYTLVWSSGSEELAGLETKITEQTAKRDEVKRRAANRAESERELEELTEALKNALRELPNDREIPELLKRISTAGKKAGLEMRKFQPLPEVAMSYYAEVPVSLEITGSYHEVAVFFDALSKLGRIVSVQDIKLEDPEERAGKVFLNVSGKAVTYRFLTEEEIAKKKADDEARKKKGGKK